MSKKGKGHKPADETPETPAANPEPSQAQPEPQPQGSVDGDLTGEFRGLDDNPGMVAPGTAVEVPAAIITPETLALQQEQNDRESLTREGVEFPPAEGADVPLAEKAKRETPDASDAPDAGDTPDPLTGTLAGDDANVDVEFAGQSREPLREDGPTLEEYIAAGYKAETYPPRGYAARTAPAPEPERRGFFADVHKVQT